MGKDGFENACRLWGDGMKRFLLDFERVAIPEFGNIVTAAEAVAICKQMGLKDLVSKLKKLPSDKSF